MMGRLHFRGCSWGLKKCLKRPFAQSWILHGSTPLPAMLLPLPGSPSPLPCLKHTSACADDIRSRFTSVSSSPPPRSPSPPTLDALPFDPWTGFFGYKNVTQIPAGARHIKVTDRSRNYLGRQQQCSVPVLPPSLPLMVHQWPSGLSFPLLPRGWALGCVLPVFPNCTCLSTQDGQTSAYALMVQMHLVCTSCPISERKF